MSERKGWNFCYTPPPRRDSRCVFSLWQSRLIARRLSSSSVPPLARATMWSTSCASRMRPSLAQSSRTGLALGFAHACGAMVDHHGLIPCESPRPWPALQPGRHGHRSSHWRCGAVIDSPVPGMVVVVSAAWRTTQVSQWRRIALGASVIRESLDQCQVLRCDLFEQAGLLLLLIQDLLEQRDCLLVHGPPSSTC